MARQRMGRPGRSRSSGKRTSDPSSHEVADPDASPIRLNRYIARAGICARRKADELISGGLVKVNGETVTQLGTRVAQTDVVEVNGKRVSPVTETYILMNKPRDCITTVQDEKGRNTVMDVLQASKGGEAFEGVFPVGRLDRDTTGVLLLTSDGELAHRLMHPRYEVEKKYVVKVEGEITPEQLEMLLTGVSLEDGTAKADRVAYVSDGGRSEIALLLHEGRNRQIRRMMEAIGHSVVRLERVSYAGLRSTGIRPGRWRKLETFEIEKLKRLVGLRG